MSAARPIFVAILLGGACSAPPVPTDDGASTGTSSDATPETSSSAPAGDESTSVKGDESSSSTSAPDTGDSPDTTGGDTGSDGVLFVEEFDGDLSRWIPELEVPATSKVAIVDGELDIEVSAGATVWFTEEITGNVAIEYEVTMVSAGGPYDRVSDLNQFWMASEVDGSDPFGRNGMAEDYFDLRLYYVGMGGYSNTRTRFRRYAGDGTRPMLGEYTDAAHLLAANATYAIRLVVQDGSVEFWVDGEQFFAHADPAVYTSGWFGFRTLESHLRIDHFRVTRL